MPNKWLSFLSAYRKKHPNKSMKQCMKDAAKVYKSEKGKDAAKVYKSEKGKAEPKAKKKRQKRK